MANPMFILKRITFPNRTANIEQFQIPLVGHHLGLATRNHLCIIEPENVIEDIEASLCCWNQVEHLQNKLDISSITSEKLHNF
jgi:hypothetical protein